MIKRGKSKSEEVLLQCHFVHQESQLKLPGIETTNPFGNFAELLGRRIGGLQVVYYRGENGVTYVAKYS